MSTTTEVRVHQQWRSRRENRTVQVVAYDGLGNNGFVTVIRSDGERTRESHLRVNTLLHDYDLLEGDATDVLGQLTLDLGELTTPAYEPGMTLQQRFELFHAANPWVLRAYEHLTADWIVKGNGRIGVGMLTEIIRWQYGRQTTGRDFKINNSYRSRYVRLMLERNPGWDGLFETRELRAS